MTIDLSDRKKYAIKPDILADRIGRWNGALDTFVQRAEGKQLDPSIARILDAHTEPIARALSLEIRRSIDTMLWSSFVLSSNGFWGLARQPDNRTIDAFHQLAERTRSEVQSCFCHPLDLSPSVRIPAVPAHVRWMIRRDMPDVFAIENASCADPWVEEDFLRSLRQRNCIGHVLEGTQATLKALKYFDVKVERNDVEDKVLAYMIYELHKQKLHVLKFAVNPTYRKLGLEEQLIGILMRKIHIQSHRRHCADMIVRETYTNDQIILRTTGFDAKAILKSHFPDTGEDGILFENALAV